MGFDELYRDNQGNWDDRALVHTQSTDYRVEQYATDPSLISDVVAYDMDLIGPIDGLKVVHLQCHIGTDTVSLARSGASEVIGVDFSANALATGRDIVARSGDAVRFVEASVYDGATAVGEKVDFVYTSVGTITWLHDIEAWAAAIAGLLDEGGRFFIRDIHPILWTYEELNGLISPTYSYFQPRERPLSWDHGITYTDNPGDIAITNKRHHEWNHPVSSILNALIGAGLRIDRFDEHQGVDWEFVDSAIKEGHQWFLPEPLRSRVPGMFSLHATKAP